MKIPTRKAASVKPSVALFRELTEPGLGQRPLLRALRGSQHSDVLMITAPPTQEEFDQQMPFIGQDAQMFHNLLHEFCGLSTEEDFLIVSSSLYGLKPNKASTTPIANFVRECAKQKLFKKYVVVGEHAFKFALGEGKKPSMHTMVGSTMHIAELCHTPLFVFPNIEPLNPVFNGDRREDFFKKRLQQETARAIENLALKFSSFLQK